MKTRHTLRVTKNSSQKERKKYLKTKKAKNVTHQSQVKQAKIHYLAHVQDLQAQVYKEKNSSENYRHVQELQLQQEY